MPWVAAGLIPANAPLGTALVEPFDLGDGVQLAPVPDFLEHLAGPGLDWAHLGWLSPMTDYVLLCPYDMAVDPGFTLSVVQREAVTRLCIANLAVWLAEPGTDLRFRYTLHVDRSQGVQGLRHTYPGLPLQSLREKRPTTFAVLDEARQLNDRMATLPKGGPVWMAIYNSWQALTEGGFFGRYAQLWTALEALFGPRKGDAVTFRERRPRGRCGDRGRGVQPADPRSRGLAARIPRPDSAQPQPS